MKKLTALMLIFCMMLCLMIISVSAQESYIAGDSDGDGMITVLDATTIQRVLAGLKKDPDGMITMRGNITSGGLNILDATTLQRYLAGYATQAGIGDLIESAEPTNAPAEATYPPTEKPTKNYELPFIPIK